MHRSAARFALSALALAITTGFTTPTPALAEGSADERIAALERKVELLSRETERQQLGGVFGTLDKEGHYGMGTSASKVYNLSQGVSVGGYGGGPLPEQGWRQRR